MGAGEILRLFLLNFMQRAEKKYKTKGLGRDKRQFCEVYWTLEGVGWDISKNSRSQNQSYFLKKMTESEVIIMLFGIGFIVFIGLCIYHACEKELPAGYHNNWRLEEHDAQLVREGKMTKRQFLKNMDNGKYRQGA